MHPAKIKHGQTEYDLSHLSQTILSVSWSLVKDAHPTLYSVRIRYSDHCYSMEIDAADLLETDTVVANNPLRVFAPDRHARSLELVKLVENLCSKPTTYVLWTVLEHNWHTYQIYMNNGKADRYCIFFSVRKALGEVLATNGHIPIDVYVQSAYVRSEIVKTSQKKPFGALIAETWNKT